jgi:hypothetical protein
MKKILQIGVILAFLLALVPAGSEANSGTQFPMYAGQDTLVGYVEVSNDADYLYVEYVVNVDGWCMTETHLHVGDSTEDFPLNNAGNPKVGQFEYAEDDLGCVTSWAADPIALEGLGSSPIIAAHAVVVRPIYDCKETVWQIGDVELVSSVTGWLENYADEFNWGDPAGPTTAGPSLAVDEPAFTDPFVVGTTPTSQFPYNSNFNRGYATDFDVIWSGELLFGGRLTLSWSPGQSAAEKKVVSDAFGTVEFLATGTPRPGEGWFLDTYPLVEHTAFLSPVPDGEHTINFQHTEGDGTFWDWIRLEKPCEKWETAWAGDEAFGGNSWATYFTYELFIPYAEGDVELFRPGWPDDDYAIDFYALEIDPSNASFFLWEQTVDGSAGFHDVPTVDSVEIWGNHALFSGVVECSHKLSRIGQTLFIYVEDNGLVGSGDIVRACWENTAACGDPEEPLSSWSYYEVVSGDIEVYDYPSP